MYRFVRALHNYLGLILFIQIGLWFLSGLVMAYLPIEEVRGNHLKAKVDTLWHGASISPEEVLRQHADTATLSFTHRLSLITAQNTPANKQLTSIPVYQVTQDNQLFSYNALSGEALAPINEEGIQALAFSQYLGSGAVDTVVMLTTLPQEVKNLTLPLWQVSFNDELGTRFYLNPETGAVQRVRTDTWRLFDLMWMLHIMDYKDRSNFNSPWLIVFAASALFFTLTGVVLLYKRFRPKRRRSIFKH